MNKQKAFELLAQYLEEYGAEFHFHNLFLQEIQQILDQNAKGHEAEVFNLMIKQFGFVKTMTTQVNKADSNEILSYTSGCRSYYSLHIQNRIVNIRMLMTFTDAVEPVFLATFNEKSGKRISDYSNWIPVLQERSRQIGIGV